MILALAIGCGGAKANSVAPPPPPAPAPKPTRGTGLASKDALYKATVAAFKDKSAEPLVPAVPTAEAITKACPGLFKGQDLAELDRDMADAVGKTQRKIDGCWKRGDLAQATFVEARDEGQKPDKECTGLTNASAKLVIRSGATEVIAGVSWVVLPDGRIFLDDPPHCDSPEADAPVGGHEDAP